MIGVLEDIVVLFLSVACNPKILASSPVTFTPSTVITPSLSIDIVPPKRLIEVSTSAKVELLVKVLILVPFTVKVYLRVISSIDAVGPNISFIVVEEVTGVIFLGANADELVEVVEAV